MIRPVGSRILIKPETIQSSLLHVESKQPVFQGEVKAIGRDVERVQPHDIVYFGRLAGHKVRNDGVDYVMILEKEVLGYERTGLILE